MKKYIIGILLYANCLGCISETPKLELIVLNNYEFILNENHYMMDEFSEVFRVTNQEMQNTHLDNRYDIYLHVNKGVSLLTLQDIKIEFVKFKKKIREIKYSYSE